MAGLLCAGSVAGVPEAARTEPASGELLVRYRPVAAAQRIAQIERDHGLERRSEAPHLRLVEYAVPGGSDLVALIDRLEQLPEVAYAEPNYMRYPQAQPADPLFSEQWSLSNTGQRVNGRAGPPGIDINWLAAVEVFEGAESITVAVVDTGVSPSHPDLAGRLWENPGELPGNGLDDDQNGFVDDVHGWDFFDGDAEPFDENGHGTLVASQIAAIESDVGVVGVARTARIMALRILNDFGFSRPVAAMDLIRATTYASRQGARVVNLSLGGSGFLQAELEQFRWLDERGVLVVAAAGNGGGDGLGDDNDVDPVFPASYDVPGLLSVAAVDRSGQLASFSNFGLASVDLAAPGTDIVGADVSRVATFLEDFESGAPDWTAIAQCQPCADWALFLDATGNTWATDSMDLITKMPAPYAPATDTWLLSPVIALPDVGPRLDFRTWWELAPFDLAGVSVSTDPTDPPDPDSFELLGTVVGVSLAEAPGTSVAAGTTLSADLSPYAGQAARLRFRILSDGFLQADGFYVDDVAISAVEQAAFDGTQFQTLSGTSFAAPLVAGAGALLMSHRPALSHREVADLLLDGVQPDATLAGRVVSGGRLDLAQSLVLAPEAPHSALLLVAISTLAGVRVSAFRR